MASYVLCPLNSMIDKPTFLTIPALNDILESYCRFLECWKVGLYYGSCLYFELGDRTHTNVRGELTEVGSATLILYAEQWSISQGNEELTNSKIINHDIAETLLQEVCKGRVLSGLDADDNLKLYRVKFGNEILISLKDIEDAEKSGDHFDDLLALFLPDGRIVGCRFGKGHILQVTESREGKEHWRRSHLS